MASLKMGRRTFLATAGASGIALLGAGCATRSRVVGPASGDPTYVARLHVRHPAQIRILQVTDLHYFSGKTILFNKKTSQVLARLVELSKPDLVMATGDLWPGNDNNDGERFMRSAISQFEALKTPWAFTWGNHDELTDYRVGHEAFATAKNSLYRGADSDGNYVIDLIGPHHRAVWQLLCLNSHREGLQDAERQWLRTMDEALRKAGQPVPPRMAFFHIPIKQYDDMWNGGRASGIKGEVPCIEKEDGSSLPVLKSIGVRACFCGHDHSNDYAGVVDGVELVYGRATGAGGYGARKVPKGGKLITINAKAGTYTWDTLLPDGSRWKPEPGVRVDKTAEEQ